MDSTLNLTYLKVTKPKPFVAHVQMARAPVNAFNVEFWKEYASVLDNIHELFGDVRAIVLSSALPKIFSVGIDFEDLLTHTTPPSNDPARTALALREHILSFQAAISAPERCLVPVIAAIHGIAYGLAVDIITACDIRYAASDARFSIKEVDVGLAPDIGTLARLPHVTSNASFAAELTYTAQPFTAEEALRLGLVSRIVEGGRDQVVKKALELAEEVSRKSPVAIMSAKRLLMHARDHSVAENLDYTAAWNAAMLQTADIPKSVRVTKARGQEHVNFEPLPRKLIPPLSASDVKSRL